MHRIFVFAATCLLGLTAIGSLASARDGFILKCPPNNGECEYTRIPAPSGEMRWYSQVYVEGNGDLGRVRVGSRGQCQNICDGHPQCVLAEYYYGPETRSNMCNMFSFVPQLRRNREGDAQVGLYR